MDYAKHQSLHTILMLQDLLRKWWQAELFFADSEGAVVNWRGSEEGLRRCSPGVRVLSEKFRNAPKLRRPLSHVCQLGFQVIGAPVYVGESYQGMLFVEGLGPQPLGVDGRRLTDVLELGVTELVNHELALRAAQPFGAARIRFEELAGTSAPMQGLFRTLEKVIPSDAAVLVQGESGTGKELVARALHRYGPRQNGPFVVQNCAALNDNLLESALFGHIRGAFTGALRDKKGLFEAADGGTFFLDEVGDMSPALQVKLLRVLQEGTFLPVGGDEPRQVDVRLIAATHKELGELVQQGLFREDLFYRIHVIRIVIPPLRERKEDIPILVDHLLKRLQRRHRLSPEALAVLSAYDWPGNVRELENEIERLSVLGADQELLPADLISGRILEALKAAPGASLPTARALSRLNEAVELLERDMIRQGLARTHNNKSRLARELGISRSNLILKIAKYGLDAGRDPADGASA